MVRSLVPVSVRAPGEANMRENRVSAVLADLPVHVADPVERLAAVQAELQALKTAHEAKAGEALVALGRYTPFPLLSWWVRLVFGLPQREIVTVTTNVPGPRQPLYAMGRRLVEILPYVPIATTVRTGVCDHSYCGSVTFGITGDFTASPDLDVLARGIESACRNSWPPPSATSEPRSPHVDFGSGPAVRRPPRRGPGTRRSRWSAGPGCSHSSAKVRVRISLASGSCRASLFASRERVDQVDPVSQDQRRRGDGPALVDGRGDGPEQDAVQHGGDFVRVRCGRADE